MNMRPYRDEDLLKVMEIANIAWRPIRKMSRAALGDSIADILNPAGDDVSKGLQVKDQINGGIAERHFIGETGTYIVVDSKGHIVNRMENDPTWDPSCCGTCYKTNYGGSGGGLHLPQFNATGNSGRRPVKI